MKPLHTCIYPDMLKNPDKKITAFVRKLLDHQVKTGLPVLTIAILPLHKECPQELLDQLTTVFAKLAHSTIIADNQIKISVLGKWYDLPEEVTESIKASIKSTKDYDGQFLNFLIKYDGHDDIAESCKMVTRKVLTGKMSVDDITANTIKENIYSSFFLPPNEIILLDGKQKADGMLLWDSAHSHITYVEENWWEWSI